MGHKESNQTNKQELIFSIEIFGCPYVLSSYNSYSNISSSPFDTVPSSLTCLINDVWLFRAGLGMFRINQDFPINHSQIMHMMKSEIVLLSSV